MREPSDNVDFCRDDLRPALGAARPALRKLRPLSAVILGAKVGDVRAKGGKKNVKDKVLRAEGEGFFAQGAYGGAPGRAAIFASLGKKSRGPSSSRASRWRPEHLWPMLEHFSRRDVDVSESHLWFLSYPKHVQKIVGQIRQGAQRFSGRLEVPRGDDGSAVAESPNLLRTADDIQIRAHSAHGELWKGPWP